MKNTLREVRGFRTLIQKIRNYFFKKLNINTLHHAQLWDWKEGAKETLNPFPFMLWTLREIWKDGYSWHGGTWINDPELNPDGVTKDMKINFLSKCYCSWIYVFSHLFSKYGFSWRYGNGLGRWGYTTFKWWTLTYYREHTEWFGGNNHKWKDKKFLFSKNWKDYEHEYEIGDNLGCWEEKVSEEEFYAHLERTSDE